MPTISRPYPRLKKLIILDLDETLIHATETPLEHPADFQIEPYHVYKRPFLESFLFWCFEWFEVAIWTSSSPSYAKTIVSTIFDDLTQLAFVWDSRRCTIAYDHDYFEYFSRKNLKKVKRLGYLPEAIIVVDDTPQKWQQSYGNLVCVKPFEGDPQDDELLHLADYLQQLKDKPNIRSVEKRFWRKR
jgi:RNA polymerase II subunit A small phosphatase-like protein